jgi:hypothetical protein
VYERQGGTTEGQTTHAPPLSLSLSLEIALSITAAATVAALIAEETLFRRE